MLHCLLRSLLFAAALSCLIGSASAAEEAGSEKPNVLILIADDK